MVNSMLRELWPVFVVEVNEKLQAIDDLLATARTGAADVDALFREFHTLKSNVQMVDFHALTELTHLCEDVLHGLRKTGKPLGEDIRQCLIDTADWCRQQLSRAVPGQYPQQTNAALLSRLAPFVADANLSPTEAPTTESRPDEEKNALTIESLRISGDALDDLVTRINQLSIHASILFESPEKNHRVLQDNISDMQRAMLEFQHAVAALAIVPLSAVFTHLPRIVRKHANSSGKQVQLLVEGGELAIDKSMAEIIAEPLIRTLQQVLNDDIEAPAVRKASNKPGTATIKIIASERSQVLYLDISCDGGNPQRLQFPFPVAIQNTLVVRTGGQVFAIPTSHVLELMDVPTVDLQIVNNIPAITLHDNTLPVYFLADLLQLDNASQAMNDSATLSLLILQRDTDCIALAVDELVGLQDLFPCEIHRDLRDMPGVNGVSILGDGTAIIILDAGDLFLLAASADSATKGVDSAR